MADGTDKLTDGDWANVVARNTFIVTMIGAAIFIGVVVIFIFL